MIFLSEASAAEATESLAQQAGDTEHEERGREGGAVKDRPHSEPRRSARTATVINTNTK